MSEPRTRTKYLYDGSGRRASKSNGKLYWYGSGGEILAETDACGNTTAEYIFFGGQRIAMIPWSGASCSSTVVGNPSYYVEDLLGTSRVITTSSGVVCYDADFYPFGGERTPYTNNCPSSNNYKFEGKERDTETGNDDFGARYYSNRFGRWLSADWSSVPVPVPYANLTNPQTLNLYSMVSDDPESFADLDGHCTTLPPVVNSCASKTSNHATEGEGFLGFDENSGIPDWYLGEVSAASAEYAAQQAAAQNAKAQQQQALVPLPEGLKYTVATPGPNSPDVHVLFAPEVAKRLGEAIQELNKEGIVPKINSAFRTNDEQTYMQSGGSGTNPAATVSWHQAGGAVDINGTKSPQFKTIIGVMEKHGFVWGGNFKPKGDPPHFDARKFMGNLNQAVRKAQSYWDSTQ
jgi:RHS repeat-associated protein